jgi:hypothetical protein
MSKYWICLALPLVLGSALAMARMWDHPYFTGDSYLYLQAANNLASGHGLVVAGSCGTSERWTHFPPLYPALLAIGPYAGLDALSWVRCMNVLLFLLLMWMVERCILQRTQSIRLAFSAGLLTALAPFLLQIYSSALSETVFLVTVPPALMLLVKARAKPTWRVILAAGAVTATAMLCRHVGIAMLLTGLVVVGAGETAPFRRWGWKLSYAMVSTLPPGLWSLWNRYAGGMVTDRHAAWHPIEPRHLKYFLGTMGSWFFPVTETYYVLAPLGLAVLALLGLLTLRPLLQGFRPGTGEAADQTKISLQFMAIYLLFLLVSLMLFDKATPLDGRMLSPALLAGVLGLFCILPYWRTRIQRPLYLIVSGLSLTVVLGAYAIRDRQLIQGASDLVATSNFRWEGSQAMESIRHLRPEVIVYTNELPICALFTGHPCVWMPTKTEFTSGLPRAEYPRELALCRRRLDQGQAVLLWLDQYEAKKLPPEEVLGGPKLILHLNDALLYASPRARALLDSLRGQLNLPITAVETASND